MPIATPLSSASAEAARPTSSLEAAQHRSHQLEAAIAEHPDRFRVLTGDRPTGPLHVGHLFGTLVNRVRLQDLGADVLVLIADYQTLTDRDAPASLPADVLGLVADYLAVGIDPERSTVFAHSQIPALNQLMVPFLSLVSVAEVSRNPTVKDEFATTGSASMSALMYAYPVHQAADILFCRATVVPVGKDQLPHLELTRTIARRFNDRYSPLHPYFPEPDALLSETPLLLGTDGEKMGKSRNNAIALAADEDHTARLVRGARTDSERNVTYEPDRRPEVANLVRLAALCLDRQPQQVVDECGAGGARALKETLTEALNERLRPLRARRRQLMGDPAYLRSVLASGNERAQSIAEDTMATVGELLHTNP
jgi:tryptophanyl-tRNA synthetase